MIDVVHVWDGCRGSIWNTIDGCEVMWWWFLSCW